MQTETRKCVSAPLDAFVYDAKEESFIQVTEWSNGEGYDIDIDEKHISLSHLELSAINYMTAHLEFGDKTDFK